MIDLALDNAARTEALGACIATQAPHTGVITLSGELGAGKTTLVRGFLRALGYQGAVKSPTYTLIEPYEFNGRRVMHLDLYRLGETGELDFLGLRDLLTAGTLCLIEWPERAAGALPPPGMAVTLRYAEDGRSVQLQAMRPDWRPVVEAVAKSISE